MSYQGTLDFLFNQLANYHKSGGTAYKPGLERIQAILNQLDDPHLKFKSIHVAGTNGKGSVSHMLASVLQEAGYKTGLFTSPHLIDFRERIKINGTMIPKEEVVAFVDNNKESFTQLNASFFEWSWAMACKFFAKEKVDFVIVEVGLGGRLDATNIILPEISIITSIGMDHVAMLGNSIAEIAREKGGIIKPSVPVIIGDVPKIALTELSAIANKQGAPIYRRKDTEIETDLKGDWQTHNAQLAERASELLGIEESHIKAGLLIVKGNTGLAGRLQLIQEAPDIYCDTAHNLDAWKVLVEHFKQLDLHLILGFVNDKDVNQIASVLPSHWIYYLCEPNSNRAESNEKVANVLLERGLKVHEFDDIESALTSVKAVLKVDDTLLVSGSNYLIGDFLKII